MPSSTEEDYLKTILRHSPVSAEEIPARLGRIARDLAVTPGTVTQMMKHLAARDLVVYRPRQGVILTPAGRTTALGILRRHRVIETFLVEVMGLDWAEVHDEAEVLEHVVSDRLIERMDEMLDRPAYDPHGSPIPDASGVAVPRETFALADCRPGSYRLVQVEKGSRELLVWLGECGLKPGAKLVLEEADPAVGTLTIRCPCAGREVSIGQQAATHLRVEPLGSIAASR